MGSSDRDAVPPDDVPPGTFQRATENCPPNSRASPSYRATPCRGRCPLLILHRLRRNSGFTADFDEGGCEPNEQKTTRILSAGPLGDIRGAMPSGIRPLKRESGGDAHQGVMRNRLSIGMTVKHASPIDFRNHPPEADSRADRHSTPHDSAISLVTTNNPGDRQQPASGCRPISEPTAGSELGDPVPRPPRTSST
jgi:hypothetical protein